MNASILNKTAQVLRQQMPDTCELIDQLLRAGQPAEAIERAIARECPRGSIIPGLANAYLQEVDPDFRRREEQRQWAREARR